MTTENTFEEAVEAVFKISREQPSFFWEHYEMPMKSMARALTETRVGQECPDDWRYSPVTGNPLDNAASQILIMRPDGSSALSSELLDELGIEYSAPRARKNRRKKN